MFFEALQQANQTRSRQTIFTYLRQSLCVLYSIVALAGILSSLLSASLILAVVAWSEAVRFQILKRYS
jgi:hypothetical protein